MRKIVYSVAMSLDGFLAGPNGEVDWLVIDPEIDFKSFMERFDVLLMGRRTFEHGQAIGGIPNMPGLQTILISQTLRQNDHPEYTIFSSDIGKKISQLRSGPGKDIWLFGGGVLFRSLLDLDLVNTVEVAVLPILLGKGIPFLPERSVQQSLQLNKNRIYENTGTLFLEYRVNRQPN